MTAKKPKFSTKKAESVRLGELAVSLANKALKLEKNKSDLMEKALIAYCRPFAGKRELLLLEQEAA